MHNTLYLSFYGNQVVIHVHTLLQNALVSILFTLAFIAAVVPLAHYYNEVDDNCVDFSDGSGECDETASDYLSNILATSIICLVRYSLNVLDIYFKFYGIHFCVLMVQANL